MTLISYHMTTFSTKGIFELAIEVIPDLTCYCTALQSVAIQQHRILAPRLDPASRLEEKPLKAPLSDHRLFFSNAITPPKTNKMPTDNLATIDPSRSLKPIIYRKPGEESKGGEYHGGPRRWTGRGPPPARHIPWPEVRLTPSRIFKFKLATTNAGHQIFKHHISVIEGHKKMVDMVRKHTVSGTGNWRTINDMFNRTEEMLKMSKQLSYSFVCALAITSCVSSSVARSILTGLRSDSPT